MSIPRWSGAGHLCNLEWSHHHGDEEEGRRQALLMPRQPRNPGSGKKPFNGPARGPGAGQWMGGTAPKGTRPAFTAETARLAVEKRDDPEAKAIRYEVAAQMLNVLVEVATTDESGAARANAADKALDRVIGKVPQQTNIGGTDGGPLEIRRVIVDPRAPA